MNADSFMIIKKSWKKPIETYVLLHARKEKQENKVEQANLSN